MTRTADADEHARPNGSDRRSAQREATRARLYEETVAEFRERGFGATEIAAVTERVGISRGAFYVHFSGKDEVLRDLLMIEEQHIADVARAASTADSLQDLFQSVVDAVLAAELRLGRQLVRDLCAAQFRPEFAQLLAVDDHPLGLMLVDEISTHSPADDPLDLTMVFLTGLFGLLATDDAPVVERRRRLDLLIRRITDHGGSAVPTRKGTRP